MGLRRSSYITALVPHGQKSGHFLRLFVYMKYLNDGLEPPDFAGEVDQC